MFKNHPIYFFPTIFNCNVYINTQMSKCLSWDHFRVSIWLFPYFYYLPLLIPLPFLCMYMCIDRLHWFKILFLVLHFQELSYALHSPGWKKKKKDFLTLTRQMSMATHDFSSFFFFFLIEVKYDFLLSWFTVLGSPGASHGVRRDGDTISHFMSMMATSPVPRGPF